ncbi:MAG: undecaprenyl-diphosphate phosphatase [Candidatus Koribacter versatilis]|uniref:Undecaprenyl-diphosphatase n=1 Tax=Candidatus Korobacter versatilis TaxID=658062 RepID=A0A932A7B1_9BACT|nr:undecaprenyl-diphosphate phosphatase [Candidatus Koribacter versatilis]
MHDYLVSLLLGVVEGLTEFLPVSSTAHLRITESFLGIDLASGYWKMYSIVIQLGAILAVPLYFRKRITESLRTFPRGIRGDKTWLTHPLSLVGIAFVCTAVPSLLLTKVIGHNLEKLSVMAWSLIIGGVLMWLIDYYYGAPVTPHPTQSIEDVGIGQAIWVGCCQVLSAVFPGTSRSMATIAAGQMAGMSRAAALEFSFFLAMPTMAAAVVYDLYKSFHVKPGGAEIGAAPASAHEWLVLAIGFVVSFLVALGVVHWFMRWVRRRGFWPFAIYRIAAGVLVLWWAARA